jgi:hypothetical protein
MFEIGEELNHARKADHHVARTRDVHYQVVGHYDVIQEYRHAT